MGAQIEWLLLEKIVGDVDLSQLVIQVDVKSNLEVE